MRTCESGSCMVHYFGSSAEINMLKKQFLITTSTMGTARRIPRFHNHRLGQSECDS